MNDKIDIVIPWVDDNDEKWIKKKKYWQEKYGISANNVERYRNWNNLKYIFRGIEKYAPWVNHVFLVTDEQKPDWLDTSYSKVTLVDHKDIIATKHLPVFNASAIELNIHKIKKLSNNFIYFNDDTFIIDEVKETDFFINNKPVDIGVMEVIYPKTVNYIQKVIINNLGLINENFTKRNVVGEKPSNWFNLKYGKYNLNNLLLLRWPVFTNFINQHLPLAFHKSTFEMVWTEYPQELENTINSKFRRDSDYNAWLMRYWQLTSNNFIPRNNKLGLTIQLRDYKDAEKSAEIIRNNKFKLFCINDNEYTKEFEKAQILINKSFMEMFPEKSDFEL